MPGHGGLRMFGFPREPSVAGIMLVGSIAALLLSHAGPVAFAAGLLITLLHLLTFDAGFNAARARRPRALAVVGLVNLAPYLALAVAGLADAALLTVAGLLLALATASMLLLGPANPVSYILGSMVPALPSLAVPAGLGIATGDVVVFWLLYSLYTMASAAYVETRLPYRSLPAWVPLALWAPALPIALAYKPLLAIALLEPTAKITVNLVRPSKVPRERIRRLGFTELARLLLFTTLAAVVLHSDG